MSDLEQVNEPDGHGLEDACYAGGHGRPYYQPYIKCVCGWSVREETWQAVGVEFDDHLSNPATELPVRAD